MLPSQESENLHTKYLRRFRQEISKYFTLDEMTVLAFELNIEWEDLIGQTRSSKALSLIISVYRYNQIKQFFDYLQQARPFVNWEDFIEISARVNNLQAFIGQYDEAELFIRELQAYHIKGLQQGPPQLTAGITNFFTRYLGTEQEPVPFGGRKQQLKALEDWRQQSNQQRLLIVAPGGRGKSALLVRWSQQLFDVPNLVTIFLPISIRFNTNRAGSVFAYLARRLAYVYKREIPSNAVNFTPELWQNLVSDYLQEPLPNNQNLLIIVDGLDEAAWDIKADLFPLMLPSTTKIAISARHLVGEPQGPEAWLRRLGWDTSRNTVETQTLSKLKPADLREILIKMELYNNNLADQYDISVELYRLSQGDPLLVELYVKDLWHKDQSQARLKLADLHQIKPGYLGFFQKWWEDQEDLWGTNSPINQLLVNDILDILAMAIGPLHLEEIQTILRARGTHLNGRMIRHAMSYLERFILEDGHQKGFVLTHPKLAEYFQSQLTEKDKQTWQNIFIQWGRETLEGLITNSMITSKVPPYLCQYYGRHLEIANAPVEVFIMLISKEWMEVWYQKERNYSGFLEDISRVWTRLEEHNTVSISKGGKAHYIGYEIFCALCYASINSLVYNLPNDLLPLLLQYNDWTEEQIIAYIRQRKDSKARGVGFVSVLPYLSEEILLSLVGEISLIADEVGNESTSIEILKEFVPYLPIEVLKVTQRIGNENKRASILNVLAPYLPQETLSAARMLQNKTDQAYVFINVAPHIPQGRRQSILEEAFSIALATKSAFLLSQLALHMPKEILAVITLVKGERLIADVLVNTASHLPLETLRIAKTLNDPKERAKVLTLLLPHLPQETFASTLNNAIMAANIIDGRPFKITALANLTPYLPANKRKEVFSMVLDYTIEIGGFADHVAVNMFKLLPAQYIPEVLQLVQGLDHKKGRALMFVHLAPYLTEENCLIVGSEAVRIANELGNADLHLFFLVQFIPYLPVDMRQKLTNIALKEAQAINDSEYQAALLAKIANYLPDIAMSSVDTIDQEAYRANVLSAIAPHFPKKTLTAAAELKHLGSRSLVLLHVAPFLHEELKTEIFKEAVENIKAITDNENLAKQLFDVAQFLPEEMQPSLFAEAVQATRFIIDEGDQAELLISLAEHVPKATLHIIQQYKNEKWMGLVLEKLAPHLPLEALSIVRQMHNRIRQVHVLKMLIPHLPYSSQSKVIDEAIRIARLVREPLYRATALEAIAPLIPKQRRSIIYKESLKSAQSIVDELTRARRFAYIAQHLPKDTLLLINSFQDEKNKAIVLSALAPIFPRKVFAFAGSLRGEKSKAEIYSALAPFLPNDIYAAATTIKDEYNRADVLIALSSHLPLKTLIIARQINDSRARAGVYINLAPHLPEPIRSELLNDALFVVESDIIRAETFDGFEILWEIMSYVPREMALTTSKIYHKDIRVRTFSELNNHLIQLSNPDLYALWKSILPNLSDGRREHLLADLNVLLPIIQQLGDETAVEATWEATQSVFTWWP